MSVMNVEELEAEIKTQKEALATMEAFYEKEEDENKQQKYEFQISRKEDNLEKLIDRQQKLLDREAKDEEKEDPKDKNAEEEDLDVCSECGSDLQLIGKDENGVDVYECISCRELFLDSD